MTSAVWLDRFAYAVPGGASFPAEAFDFSASVLWEAEAYGGEGMAGNGGGARAGLSGGLLIKGCGGNPLVGLRADPRHAYGALYLEHALAEAIYAQLVDLLLPLGSVHVHGVADTGVPVDFTDHAGCRHIGLGGLLFRDACLRPAHFLEASGFVPRANHRQILSERQRIRRMMSAFADRRGKERFEKRLYDFLGGCAAQFGTARAMSLAHGSLSSANLALDGRWLDLSHASLLPGGCNVKLNSAQPTFLNEASAPLDIAVRLIYQFGKYGLRPIAEEGIARFYDTAYRAAHGSALLRRAGLPTVISHRSTPQEVRSLLPLLSEIVTGSGKIRRFPASDGRGEAGFERLLDSYLNALAGESGDALTREIRECAVPDGAGRAGGAFRAKTSLMLALLKAWSRHHAFLLLGRDVLTSELKPILAAPESVARLADRMTITAREIWKREDQALLYRDDELSVDYVPDRHRLAIRARAPGRAMEGAAAEIGRFLESYRPGDAAGSSGQLLDRLRALLKRLSPVW